MNSPFNDYPRERFVAISAGDIAHDPFHCLRCFSIAVAIWNILYCVLQFGLLGWQVQVVKQWQWHWENRALPVTGAIDQYQARFPGLYAIYTETPERRRVNAMYAIVLLCLGLTLVHFVLSAAMLYGCVKRLARWILPWFFSALPLIVLSTAYSVLWWSGDVFNEQLTFSVAQFVMSLAVNGVCFVVVLLYFLRLRGKLTSERTNGEERSPNDATLERRRRRGRTAMSQQFGEGRTGQRAAQPQNWQQKLPPWVEQLPDKVPANIARKLRRKERRERELREKVGRRGTEEAKQRERKRRENAIGGRARMADEW